MKKLLSTAVLAAALAGGALGLTAMRSGDPSGLHQPVVDQDDVLGVQCTPRLVTANTTLSVNDNHCGVIVTSAATVTVPAATTLGEGFEAFVWADGATATVAANTNVSVTTGLFAAVRIAHAKRWVGPVSTPGNTPG